MKKIIILASVLFVLSACAIPLKQDEYYARQFSGSVGCPWQDIKIINIDSGMSSSTVLLECNNKKFYCTRQNTSPYTISCKEALK